MRKLKFLFMVFILVFSFGVIRNEMNETVLEANTVKDERNLKGVWVSSFIGEAPYSSETQFKAHMNGVLDIMEHYGYNALIFHVRTHNNAFYKSELNPVASWWSRANFDVFDPLTWLIEETHSRGMEFHAWMNPYRVSTTYQSGTVPANNPQNNPNNLIQSGANTILNPNLQIVRAHINDTITEFLEMYPTVEAIHFDDYFYVETTAYPTDENARRQNVNLLIEGISDLLDNFNANNNTYVQLGISPTGIYKNGNGVVSYDSNGHAITTGSDTRGFAHYGNYLYADTVKWAEEGWIDYLAPQVYWARNHNVASFTKILSWWDKVFKNLDVNLYTGIGIYMSRTDGNYSWSTTTTELAGQLDEVDSYNNVLGYMLYSFKDLEAGYKNTGTRPAQHVNNAYNEKRSRVMVLPEIKSMTPVIPGDVTNIVNNRGVLTWNPATNGKFYYIYRSTGEVTFSSDEIIGVVGGNNLTYNTGDTTNVYNYGIRALSGTNHLSGVPEEEPLPTYSVNYVLNGGNFELDYANRDEMLMEFFSDFYDFLNIGHLTLDQFVHGYGATSGYDGFYDLEDDNGVDYLKQMYSLNNKSINPSTGKFINQPEYNKWVPLLDLIDDYVKTVNSSQTLWGSYFEGRARIKDFMQQRNYGNPTVDPLLNKIPTELHKGVNLIEVYTEETQTFELPEPSRLGYTFKGWYKNSNLTGAIHTVVTKGTTGNLTFYAKWEEDVVIPDIVTVEFDLGYDNLYLNSQTLNSNSRLTKPTNPTRVDYIFLGWYKDGTLYDFNNRVYEDFTLVALWQKEQVTVYFDLGYSGLFLDPQTIDKGTKVTKPVDPSRPGYQFLGWYKGNATFNFNISVIENTELVARWEEVIIYHSVTFNANYPGGVNPSTQTIIHGGKVTKPNNPVRADYVFLGWFKDNLVYDFNSGVTSNIVLVAKWEKETVIEYVTVTFNIGYSGGVNPSSQTIIMGGKALMPADPVRPGYEFLGWYLGDNLFNFDNPVNYTLVLTAKYNEIHLEDFVAMKDGASIRLKTEETKQGLRFYAQVCNCYKTNLKGFYVAYGNVSIEDLKLKIQNSNNQDIYINGKKVFRQAIGGLNDDNEFSVVLTGIPLKGYLDKITVVPYVVINGVITLGESKVTRSVADVAFKGFNQEGLFADLLDEINNDLYVYENNNISKDTIYELDRENLKLEFVKDYNEMFDADFVDLNAYEFYDHASFGPLGTQNRNRDISETRLYAFFNHPYYGVKWDFVIEILLSFDAPHPTRQIIALRGDGTNNNQDGWSNRGVLYKANHLIYSIANFFNGQDLEGGFPTLTFVGPENYQNLKDYNNTIVKKELNGQVNYILKGTQIVLKEADQAAPSGFVYKYYDGYNYYDENDTYIISKEVQLELMLMPLASESYTVMFYDEDIELIDLYTTYNEGESKTLPTPEKEGYTFIGWYDNKLLTGPTYTSIKQTDSGNKSFYAKFEVIESNTITYELNGGNFGMRFVDKDEMINKFLEDYYDYLLSRGFQLNSLNAFKHGVDSRGRDLTSGYDGQWHSEHKGTIYRKNRPTSVDNNYFISSADYMEAWLPFFDMMQEFVVNINSTQNFYGSQFVGLIRIREYFIEYGWSSEHDEVFGQNINMMPREFTLPTDYFENGELEVPIPIRSGYDFLGWFLDEDFNTIVVDPSQLEGDVTLYAKWS